MFNHYILLNGSISNVWNLKRTTHGSLSGGQSLTTHQNPTRPTWIGALIHGNFWKDQAEREWGAQKQLWIPILEWPQCFSFLWYVVASWSSKSAIVRNNSETCLPSGKPSFPSGSLKMGGWLKTHTHTTIKYDCKTTVCLTEQKTDRCSYPFLGKPWGSWRPQPEWWPAVQLLLTLLSCCHFHLLWEYRAEVLWRLRRKRRSN